jgi:hypothetical protein
MCSSDSKEGYMKSIMLIGAGDLGIRVATSLMLREKIDELTLVDLPSGGGPTAAEYMACCNTIPIHFEGTNCLDTSAVEGVIRKHKPDLIVFGASLRSSETVMRTEAPRGQAMWKAGLGVQLPFQLPILISVMRAVKNAAPDTLVANFTIPDTSHKILHAGGLAPTAGLLSWLLPHGHSSELLGISWAAAATIAGGVWYVITKVMVWWQHG